jgi:Tfp pilus assembly protein PilF
MSQAHAAKTKTTGRDALILLGALAVIIVGYFVFRERNEPPQAPSHAGQATEGMGQAGMTLENLPADYGSLVKLGNQQMDGGNYALAAESYRRALELDGSSVSVRTDFGACLHGMGLPDRALEEFRKVLAADPAHIVATFNMGIVFFNQNKTDSAKVYFNKVIAQAPGDQMALRAQELLDQIGS